MNVFKKNWNRLIGKKKQKQLKFSDPYIIQITNKGKEPKTAKFFGFNYNFNLPNLGNDEEIEIKNFQGRSYAQLFAQSGNEPFKVGRWRFQSSTPLNLRKRFYEIYADSNGNERKEPINLAVMLDAYQQQQDVLDITKVIKITGKVSFEIELEPESKLIIAMYPVEICKPKFSKYGEAPRLSGKNVAPIIIQTTQLYKFQCAKQKFIQKIKSFFTRKKQ